MLNPAFRDISFKLLSIVIIIFSVFCNYCFNQVGWTLDIPLSLLVIILCLRNNMRIPALLTLFIGISEDILQSPVISLWTIVYCIVSYIIVILPRNDNKKAENIFWGGLYAFGIIIIKFVAK